MSAAGSKLKKPITGLVRSLQPKSATKKAPTREGRRESSGTPRDAAFKKGMSVLMGSAKPVRR